MPKKSKKIKKLNKENAEEALKKVIDPELGLDIFTLGLIYGIDIKEKNAIHIKMTFTSPMCPYGPFLIEDVKKHITDAGFVNPQVEVIFTPPWQPTKEVRMMLGLN